MAQFTDDDLIQTLQSKSPVASSSTLADELDVTRQAVHQRLTSLHTDGRVERVELGRDVGWYIADGKTSLTTGSLTASVREGSDFAVDVRDTEDEVDLLVQAGPNGYKLDLWWDDDENEKRRQSNNWVRFSDSNPADYPHDNRHSRTPTLQTIEKGVRIIDPDPRAPAVGYEGANLDIERVEDGFAVTLTWLDEYNEQQVQSALAPLADPRNDRETYYDLLVAEPHKSA